MNSDDALDLDGALAINSTVTGSTPVPITARYGTWSSRIDSSSLTEDAVSLGEVVIDGDWTYWLESRPSEGGRGVVCRIGLEGPMQSLTPPEISVRSRVHEYGGAPFTVVNQTIYFVDAKSQQICAQPVDGVPVALTDIANRRYADLVFDAKRHRLICVAEQHQDGLEASNFIVAIELNPSRRQTVLSEGHAFYAAPRVAPDGLRLAFYAWDHPNMPWDSSLLMVAEFNEDGTLAPLVTVAGGPDESAIEPHFAPSGDLWFASDRSGFWNLYRWHHEELIRVVDDEAEYSRAPWQFGIAQYGVLETGQAVAIRSHEGTSTLVMVDGATGASTNLPLPYTDLSQLKISPHGVTLIAASALDAPRLIRLDLVTGHLVTLRLSSALEFEPGAVSEPMPIKYPTSAGATSHALYYAPHNPRYQGPADERAPLIVMSHGGPTGSTSSRLNAAIQFWTSRGFAVVDVNYRGSTGYGRTYRQALSGGWGVIDVDDCVNAALYLADQDLIDRRRMAIRGGSAGGYTTLCALAFRREFAAGASYFGIGDLTALVRDTHKFESRYTDRLIGPYPQAEALYLERSPLMHLERFESPLLLLQGMEDKVVPPNQSEAMFEALSERGVPVAYIAYLGEGHGFRREQNIRRSIEAELYFYGKVFGVLPADSLEPVEIRNLSNLGLAAVDA
jgi:dipeptidyl aminopeptidase/acylaminoacyl peptidase